MSKTELLNLSDSRLYCELYDLYERGSVEAAKFFNRLKKSVNRADKLRIEKAVNQIYENEAYIQSLF